MRRFLLRLFLALHRGVYRVTGGKVGGGFGGLEVLLLTSSGRRTGKPWTTPLLFLRDGQDIIIVASNNGSDRHPGWWLNLQKDPKGAVQIKRAKMAVSAREASSEEKSRFWPLMVAGYPSYQRYQEKTEREIPVVILSPA